MYKEKKPSIKLNFVFTILFQVFSVLSSFITAPYVSRVLSVDGIGTYSYISSIQYYFILISALGTAVYGAREISRIRDSSEEVTICFWEIEFLTVITSSISTIAWIVFSYFFLEYRIYCFLLLPALVASMFDISWLFNGLEMMPLITTRNLMARIIGIVLTFVFVKNTNDLPIYFIIQSGTTLIANLSMWLELPKIIENIDFKKLHIFKHFRPTLMYFIPTIASSIYLVLDKVLLGILTQGVAENGFYTQAERIITICKNVVFMAINSVVGVRISYLYKNKQYNEIKDRVKFSFNYLAFMGYGCVFGIWAVAKLFVPLFYGPGYEKSIVVLMIFAPILLFTSISSCLNAQYYVPVGRRAECTKYIVVGSIVNLILNFVLIPKFQSCGAVTASVIAEAIISFLFWKNSDNIINLHSLLEISWKKVIAGIIMLVFIYTVNMVFSVQNVVVLLLDIFLGVSVYILSLVFFLKDEWTTAIVVSCIGFIKKVFIKKMDK